MTDSLTRLFTTARLEQLLALAMSKGADFAEVYVEHSRSNSVSLQEKQIRTASYAVTLGVGIRVIKGTEVGYAYCDDLEGDSLREAALVAASIAHGGGSQTTYPVTQGSRPDRYPVLPVPDAIAPEQKVALLRRGDAAAHAFDARISQVMGSFTDQTKDIVIATTEGTLVEDRQVMCRINFATIVTGAGAKGSGERRTGFHGGGGRVPFSHFESFTPELVAREAARMAVAQLGAVHAPAGPQTVVLSPGWSGILLHEAVGHGLEADFIRKGTSLYAGKLGEQVASPLCTVIDSATLPHRRGSLNIDDEGTEAQEKVLIENGKLRGFMIDRLSAKIMDVKSTGSGRRESYQHAPMPRMTNTYMAPGPHTHDEILHSVKKGLYCASFGGGQVDIANGNFVFEVREGYLIEDGKLTQPVRNATLIGVGPEALKNVSMVGNNPELDPGLGVCGKDGQSVPVGVGMPTVRMDNITVGGTHVGA
jgi:TldD protein